MYDNVLRIHNVIQSDDIYSIAQICKRGFVSVIRVAVATNNGVAECGANVVGQFIACNPLKPLSGAYGHRVRFCTFNMRGHIFLFGTANF
jgi:hypothetical protein